MRKALRSVAGHLMPRILLTAALVLASVSIAWSAQGKQAVDFVRFAPNGDILIDMPGLVTALRDGTDPNWVDRRNGGAQSTLQQFLYRCFLATPRNVQTDNMCTEAVKTLIAAGAKLQPSDGNILLLPIAQGSVDIVAMLLDLGASPVSWPTTPYSPVEYAAKEGQQAVVDLLVAHGATRPNEKDALQSRLIEASSLGSAELLEELLKKGANVNGKGRQNEVALLKGIFDIDLCRSYEKTRLFLNWGADPNVNGVSLWDETTTTPLHSAVLTTSGLISIVYVRKPECREKLLAELISKGAHVSSLDSNGQTPLHIAAQRNNLLAARLIIEAGAKVMPRDKKGKTPLDWAESGEMIRLLKSHGATEQ